MDDLSDLKRRLAVAEREVTCADMIDDAQRRQSELAYWRGVVDGLKRRIAEHDPFNAFGSGPVPIEERSATSEFRIGLTLALHRDGKERNFEMSLDLSARGDETRRGLILEAVGSLRAKLFEEAGL